MVKDYHVKESDKNLNAQFSLIFQIFYSTRKIFILEGLGRVEEGVGINSVWQVRKSSESVEEGVPVTVFDLDKDPENVKFDLTIVTIVGKKNDSLITTNFMDAFELLNSGEITQSLNFIEVRLTKNNVINFNEIDELEFTFQTCDKKELEETGLSKCNDFDVRIEISEKNKAPTSVEDSYYGT